MVTYKKGKQVPDNKTESQLELKMEYRNLIIIIIITKDYH